MIQELARPGRAACLVLMLVSCAPKATSDTYPANRNVIDRGQIEATLHTNALALIRALQPHWLEVRGGGSVASPMVKRVYVDELYLGGAAVLRQIDTQAIETIEYYDGPAATQRWGTDHSAGVIQIRSRVP